MSVGPEMLIVMILVCVLCLLAGDALGRHDEQAALIAKADDPYRTAMRLGEAYYYLVPEQEYVRMQKDHITAKRRRARDDYERERSD